eukprot:3977589-Lingulodinium_polyedra.AAC.1
MHCHVIGSSRIGQCGFNELVMEQFSELLNGLPMCCAMFGFKKGLSKFCFNALCIELFSEQ